MSEDQSVERLSVAEAAERLGVTRDAIHKRIRRDSIEHEQGEDGRFYVFVDTSAIGTERSADVSIDDRTDILIAELQDRIRSLEEANRENRRIIVALTSRIPELPAAPSEARESPITFRTGPEREDTTEASGEREEATERPWWRRMFGG